MSYLEHTVKTIPAGPRKILHLNWPLALLLVAAAAVGFVMLTSVAGGTLSTWAEPQMKRFALGLVGMVAVAMVPIWFWRNMSLLAYLVSLALLVAVALVGVEGKGAQRWLDLGAMRIQPSELAKITLVMMLAAYYDWLPVSRVSRPLWVLLPVGLILVPVGLVLRQPDLGTSLLLVLGGGAMMFLAGVHWAYFATLLALGAGAVAAVVMSRGTDWQLLETYQYRRIDTSSTPGPTRSARAITSPSPRSRSARAAGPGAASCRARSRGSTSCPKSTPISSSSRWPRNSALSARSGCWRSTG